jgi:hypothetical protein
LNSKIDGVEEKIDNHIADKQNPHEVTAAQVGLGNVTNESKTTMFDSAAFTGTPTAPTAEEGTDTTQIATTAFVATATRKALNTARSYTTDQIDTKL